MSGKVSLIVIFFRSLTPKPPKGGLNTSAAAVQAPFRGFGGTFSFLIFADNYEYRD
jgi:hypothetical protein